VGDNCFVCCSKVKYHSVCLEWRSVLQQQAGYQLLSLQSEFKSLLRITYNQSLTHLSRNKQVCKMYVHFDIL
jgi:hypothetical protein